MERAQIKREYTLDRIRALDAGLLPNDDPMPEFILRDSLWWIVESGRRVAGYGGLYLGIEGEAWLVRTGVLPAFRGQHLQRRLIRTRLRAARKAGVPAVDTYTHVTNIASQRSLIACGFRPLRCDGESIYFRMLAT
jgi:GNAT superfamily N-acetyltransferase